MLNEELNRLTYRIAMNGCTKESCIMKACLPPEDVNTKSAEVFYRNPQPHFQQSDSNASDIHSPSGESSANRDYTKSRDEGHESTPVSTGTRTLVKLEENGVLVEKWDSYFNPLMECVEVRVTEIENLQPRLQNCIYLRLLFILSKFKCHF
jgi:hypothetical protein